MKLNVYLIDDIEKYETPYVRFKTGKRCWNWDETVEAIVGFTDGFDLYLCDMSEEDRNDIVEVKMQMGIYAQNTIDNWMDLYKESKEEQREFSRWYQIESQCAFTIENVAEVLKISPATVRNRIKKLGIEKPSRNKFAKWEFCRDEFDHLIALMIGGVN